MGCWFQGVSVGTGEVWIISRLEYFVADECIKHTHFEIQAVSDRGMEGDISLLDGEIRGNPGGLGSECICIRAKQQIDLVTCAPGVSRLDGFFNSQFDHVQ